MTDTAAIAAPAAESAAENVATTIHQEPTPQPSTEPPTTTEAAAPEAAAPEASVQQPANANGSAEKSEQPAKPAQSTEDPANKSPVSPKRAQSGLSVRFLEIGREYRASGGRKGMPFPWKLWLRQNEEEKAIEMVVDHKQKSAVVRVSLDSITKLATGSVTLEEEPVSYLVFEVGSAPEFYKLSDSNYTESDDWTQGQASVYNRTTILFHSPQSEVDAFVDKMMAAEEALLGVAAQTPSWPVLIQSGPTLIPVVFPEDPNDILYMTREQLEQEVLAARRKKASMVQQSRRPPQRRSSSLKGKPATAPSSPPVTATGAPQLAPNVPYTIPSGAALQQPEGLRTTSLQPSGQPDTSSPLQPESLRASVPVLAAAPVGAPAEGPRGASPAPAGEVGSVTGVKRPAPTAVPEA